MTEICVYCWPKGGHFWHWFIGEFMFSVAMAVKHEAKTLIMFHPSRNWGAFPLDRFYTDIADQNFQVILTNEKPKCKIIKTLGKQSWDKSFVEWPRRTRVLVRRAVRWLKKKVALARILPKYDHIVQLRKNEPRLTSFYKNTKTPCKKYGAARRNVKNLREAVPFLKSRGGSVECIYGDGKHLYDQIAPYINATSLTLCHGAGMAWILFMKPSPTVIELKPPGGAWSKTTKKLVSTNRGGKVYQIRGPFDSFGKIQRKFAQLVRSIPKTVQNENRQLSKINRRLVRQAKRIGKKNAR